MTIEELVAALRNTDSAEAKDLAESLENCYWDTNNDEDALEIAMHYCRSLSDWANRAHEVLSGRRQGL